MGNIKELNIKNRTYYFYDDMNHDDGFIEEKEGSKYLNFAFTDNSEVLKKYSEIWSGINKQIKAINSGESGEYGNDYIKIKFNSDDDLPLNKQLKFINLTIIVRSVFEENGSLYPQILLGQSLYEL